MKKILILISIIVMSVYILSGCREHGSSYLKLSDLVIRLMEEQGLSNCHLTALPYFKNAGLQTELPAEGMEDDAINADIEATIQDWIAVAEFELDEKEVLAFSGDQETVKRYLVVGAMGYREWGNAAPESVSTDSDLLQAYEQYEKELVTLFITRNSNNGDIKDQTGSAEGERGFGYREVFLDEPVNCYLQDEYSIVNGNQVYFSIDVSSQTYLRAKDQYEEFVVFEFTVSNPDFYPAFMILVNNDESYIEVGYHDESEDHLINPPFARGNVVFEGINAKDLDESAYIIVERIMERVDH